VTSVLLEFNIIFRCSRYPPPRLGVRDAPTRRVFFYQSLHHGFLRYHFFGRLQHSKAAVMAFWRLAPLHDYPIPSESRFARLYQYALVHLIYIFRRRHHVQSAVFQTFHRSSQALAVSPWSIIIRYTILMFLDPRSHHLQDIAARWLA